MDEKEKNKEQENTLDKPEETSEIRENYEFEEAEAKSSETENGAEAGNYEEDAVDIPEIAFPENEAPIKKRNKRLINAIIRAGSALIVAALLLTVTKLSILTLKKGPAETEQAHHEAMGSFVKQDIPLILGDLSDQGLSKNYVLAPLTDKIVLIHFTDRYLASVDAVKADTLKLVDHSLSAVDKYVTVEGTVTKQSEQLSGKVYEWYAANKSWMVQKGVVPDTGEDSTYISDVVLTVDTVNSMSETLVYVLSGIAALLLLYMIIELILMASGVYLKEPKKKFAAEGPYGFVVGEAENEDEAFEASKEADENGASEEAEENAEDGERSESAENPEMEESEKTEEDK